MYVLHENVVNTEVYSYTFTLSKKSEHYKTKVILSLLQKSCFFKVVLSFDSMYSSLSNKCAAQFINFLKNSNLHSLILSCMHFY